MLKPPPDLPGDGILVGYSLEHERHTAPIGFVYGSQERRPRAASGFLDPILHTGGGHLLTIAPTGAGKGVSCIIPTLLRFPGPVIVIDPKGENYAVTGERRRALGQEVVLLDPMGITNAPSTSALNPLDLIDPRGAQSIDDASMLSSLLTGGMEKDDPRNLFWYQRGEALLTGIIQFVATEVDESERNLSEVRKLLNLPGDDFLEFSRTRLAMADDPDVRQIAGTLINPAQEMIGSILGMAQNSLGFLRGELLHRSTARSTFELDGVTAGHPLSIFLVIPPDKLQSHRNLLRVWVGTLMAALMRRRAPMRHNTLFILDEAAQLGPLEQLRQAITLLRGYGLQTWSFWQDHSQLSNLYPMDWQTMYNNCRVHQAFGFTTLQAAGAISELSGFHDPHEALRLDSDEMLLSVSGDEAVIAQKPNYLTDPAFQGLFAENPFYRQSGGQPPAPQRSQRRYRRPGRGGGPGGAGVGADEGAGGGEGAKAGEGAGAGEWTGPGEGSGTGRVGGRARDAVRGNLGTDGDEASSALDDARDRRGLDVGATDGEEDTGRGPSLPFAPPSARELAEARGSRMPGGLAPFPGAQPLAAFQLPIVLERLERALERERDWYATGVRVDYLPFYSRFYLGEVTDPGRHPSRELYAMNGNDIRPFHGGPRAILALNREAGLLSSGSAMAHYLQFFLHFSRGRTPPVRLVQSLEELRHWTGANEEVLASCRELVVKAECAPVEGEGAGVAVTGTAVAGADLCRLRAVILPDGSPVELHLEPLREGVGAETAVVPAVAGDPGMAPIHGPWDVVPDVDRQDLLSYLTPGEREGMDAGAPLLRRTLSCYPGVDLVRLPPQDPGEEPVMLFWAGGIPLRITFRERPALNARFLAIGDPVTAEACLRLYTWLRRGPDYPITILDRPSDLDALLAADAGPGERGQALEDRWVPFRCELEGGDAYRAHFVLLEENKLLAMDILLGGDGEVRQASETEIVDGLPVDPERLARCLTLPPFGACP